MLSNKELGGSFAQSIAGEPDKLAPPILCGQFSRVVQRLYYVATKDPI